METASSPVRKSVIQQNFASPTGVYQAGTWPGDEVVFDRDAAVLAFVA